MGPSAFASRPADRGKIKAWPPWRLDPYEYVDGFVLRHGFYEEEVLEAAMARLLPGDVYWDVGSNLGLHALTVRRLRPDVSVWAFEPNPKMAALIVAACRRNALKVTLLELALDAKAGRAEFFLYEGNAGRCGLHNWESDPHLQHIEVATNSSSTRFIAGVERAPDQAPATALPGGAMRESDPRSP